jgi:hypothetical protein
LAVAAPKNPNTVAVNQHCNASFSSRQPAKELVGERRNKCKINIVNCSSTEASSLLLHQSESKLSNRYLPTGADIHGEVPHSYL